MRPKTLADVVANVRAGAPFGDQLAEFIDHLDEISDVERLAALQDKPVQLQDTRLDTLIEVIAEYLAKQHRMGRVPALAIDSVALDRPWHTSSLFMDWDREFLTDAMRGYLTFASPAEFASRNIFTEERPLRRARSTLAR
jgi:hypothetical protein